MNAKEAGRMLVAGIAALTAVQCNPRSAATDAGASPPASSSASATASAAPGANTFNRPIVMTGAFVDLTVEVGTLLGNYKGNELRGDSYYKGKRVRIIGKAGEFKRDVTNTIYMTVGTGAQLEIPEAQCFFGEEYAGWVSSLTKGSTVVIDCTVEGLMMNVLMKNCSGKAGTDTLNACYKLRDAGAAKQCSPGESSLLLADVPIGATSFYTSDLPSDAGERAKVAVEAAVLALNLDTGFMTHAFPAEPVPPASLAAKEWVERSVGLIFRLRDDVDYEQALAQIQSDATKGDFGKGAGSASARIVVVLPVRASPDLLPRVKAVVDRLAPATK